MKRKSKRNNGAAYEQHVAEKMKWLGWLYVRRIGKSGDFGADITAYNLFMTKIVVQCKNYKGKVGVHAIQEVIAARQYYRAERAAVATNSTFTRQAKQLAKKCNVELWERF